MKVILLVLGAIIYRVASEILTFEKPGIPSVKHDGKSEKDHGHLPLSSLFSQSDRYKCLIEGKNNFCSTHDVEYLNNKFGATATQSHDSDHEILEQKNEHVTIVDSDQKNGVFGPRNQKVYLQLPRRAMYMVC